MVLSTASASSRQQAKRTRRLEAQAELSYLEPGQREKISLVAGKVAREAGGGGHGRLQEAPATER